MSVIVRRTGYSYTWICKVIPKNWAGALTGKPCNHSGVADTEAEARAAYQAHKKTAADH